MGYGIGAAPGLLADRGGLGRVVDRLEQLGYDSVWFPERINSPQLDPIVATAYVAGRVERLKFGPAISVLPGRNPVAMTKAFASLDVVSNGRCLAAVGPAPPTRPNTRPSRSTAPNGPRGSTKRSR